MARYIDADELKKQIDLVQILVMGGRSQGKSLLNETMETYKKVILKKIDEQPTADVVPKSEVDSIKRYIIINEDIAIKCKQENGEENEEYWKGKISAFRQIREYIDAELKKKYTEDQT